MKRLKDTARLLLTTFLTFSLAFHATPSYSSPSQPSLLSSDQGLVGSSAPNSFLVSMPGHFDSLKTHLNALPDSPQLGSAPLMAFGVDMLFFARLLPFGPFPIADETNRLNLNGRLTNEALAVVEGLTLVRNSLRQDEKGVIFPQMISGIFNDAQRVFVKGPINIGSSFYNRNQTDFTAGLKHWLIDIKDATNGNRRLLSGLSILAKMFWPESNNPLIVSTKNFQSLANMVAIPGILLFPHDYLITPLSNSYNLLIEAKETWDQSLSDPTSSMSPDTAFMMVCTRFLALMGNLQQPLFVLLQFTSPSLWSRNEEIIRSLGGGRLLPYVNVVKNRVPANIQSLSAAWGTGIYSSLLYGNAVALQILLSEVSLWTRLHQSFSESISKASFGLLNLLYWTPLILKRYAPGILPHTIEKGCFWTNNLSSKTTITAAVSLALLDFVFSFPIVTGTLSDLKNYLADVLSKPATKPDNLGPDKPEDGRPEGDL